MTNTTMLFAALELAAHGWHVFPCWEKDYSPRRSAKAPVGDVVPNGVLNATTDPTLIGAWWTAYPHALIGARVPDPLMVIDVDPRHDGHISLAALEAQHGALPATLTTWSGRGDGGRHLWFHRSPGRLRGKNLGQGIDLKTSTGYVIVPPSRHPATGEPYRWDDAAPPAAPPPWLTDLLCPPIVDLPRRAPRTRPVGPSIADSFTENTTWQDILGPHGWRCVEGDGDSDRSRWLHPAATSACSATVHALPVRVLHKHPVRDHRARQRARLHPLPRLGGPRARRRPLGSRP